MCVYRWMILAKGPISPSKRFWCLHLYLCLKLLSSPFGFSFQLPNLRADLISAPVSPNKAYRYKLVMTQSTQFSVFDNSTP